METIHWADRALKRTYSVTFSTLDTWFIERHGLICGSKFKGNVEASLVAYSARLVGVGVLNTSSLLKRLTDALAALVPPDV